MNIKFGVGFLAINSFFERKRYVGKNNHSEVK